MREIAELSPVPESQRRAPELIGRLLLRAGKLSAADLERVIREQAVSGRRFGDTAVALGLVAPQDVQSALARQFSYPVVRVGDGRFSSALFALHEPYGKRAEALRCLRTELTLRWLDGSDGRRIIAVAGVDPDGTIATLAANLAVVFAQVGTRTLLVDCDLREPRLHAYFAMHNRQGLSNLLAGHSSRVTSILQPFQSLSLLPAGSVPPNPQELLAGRDFAPWLGGIARDFDTVVLSTPPLHGNVDAQLIAARAGAALLVARSNVTRLSDLDEARHRLIKAGVAVLGAALVD